jgi:hypothetical protein
MKKTLFIGFLFLGVSSLFAATNNDGKVVSYSNYYPAQKPTTQKQDQNQTQHQTTNIKIIIPAKTNSTKVKTRGCEMDQNAPIAPYIDNY